MARDIHLVGKELIAEYKRLYGTKTMLAFSRGKDSIAAALAIRDELEIIPVYYVTVPGLQFVEESLDYFERHLFHRKIIRFPHPSFIRQLNNFLFVDPGQAEVISAANLEEKEYREIQRLAAQQEGIDPETLTATGVRAADSPMRRMSFTSYGPIRPSTGVWFPVWDWNKAKLMEEIERAKIALPIDYAIFGRTQDGLDARFLIPLKQYLPDDYKRLLEWFPLAEAEVLRYEISQRGMVYGRAKKDGHSNPDQKDRDAEGRVEIRSASGGPAEGHRTKRHARTER